MCAHLSHTILSVKLTRINLAQVRLEMIFRRASRRIWPRNRSQGQKKHVHTPTTQYYIGQAHGNQLGPDKAQNAFSKDLVSNQTLKSGKNTCAHRPHNNTSAKLPRINLAQVRLEIISRRTSRWIQPQNRYQRLKKTRAHIPTALCYIHVGDEVKLTRGSLTKKGPK